MSPGEALCKSFEKYARAQADGTCRAYKPIPTDPWTIGWGSTGKDVTSTSWWTRLKADQRFDHSWASCKAGVLRASPILAKPENANRLEAIISFAYNCGTGAYQASTLRRYVNAERWADAANEFAKWNHSMGKVVAGLTRRRAAEKSLFGTPDDDSIASQQVTTKLPPAAAQSIPDTPPTTPDAVQPVLGQIAQLEALVRSFLGRKR